MPTARTHRRFAKLVGLAVAAALLSVTPRPSDAGSPGYRTPECLACGENVYYFRPRLTGSRAARWSDGDHVILSGPEWRHGAFTMFFGHTTQRGAPLGVEVSGRGAPYIVALDRDALLAKFWGTPAHRGGRGYFGCNSTGLMQHLKEAGYWHQYMKPGEFLATFSSSEGGYPPADLWLLRRPPYLPDKIQSINTATMMADGSFIDLELRGAQMRAFVSGDTVFLAQSQVDGLRAQGLVLAPHAPGGDSPPVRPAMGGLAGRIGVGFAGSMAGSYATYQLTGSEDWANVGGFAGGEVTSAGLEYHLMTRGAPAVGVGQKLVTLGKGSVVGHGVMTVVYATGEVADGVGLLPRWAGGTGMFDPGWTSDHEYRQRTTRSGFGGYLSSALHASSRPLRSTVNILDAVLNPQAIYSDLRYGSHRSLWTSLCRMIR